MEAKDTVMDVEEVIKIISRSLDYVPASVYCALERQAEITWDKATEFLNLTSETQYKAGIKEVINFISSPCIKHKEAIGYPSRLNCSICWRAKLKEWQV